MQRNCIDITPESKSINHLAFRVDLAEALFQQFTDTERKYRVAGRQKISFHDCRKVISSKKFLLLGKKSTPQRRCVVKHGWRKETRF
jgi:hypothetical protein